jgi:hypothetical protein
MIKKFTILLAFTYFHRQFSIIAFRLLSLDFNPIACINLLPFSSTSQGKIFKHEDERNVKDEEELSLVLAWHPQNEEENSTMRTTNLIFFRVNISCCCHALKINK